MRRVAAGSLALCMAMAGCEHDPAGVGASAPAPPLSVLVSYYAGAVTVSWELSSAWNGETFRIYAKRTTDADFFLIAEVTSCAAGVCSYEDRNVVSNVTYEYFVSAYDPDTGLETSGDEILQVFVPEPTPPPVPTGMRVVALDGALYLVWDANARGASDFSYYKVYLDAGGDDLFLLGETDSEGFLDLLALNGETSTYFVTSVDDQGHESDGSAEAAGTPRPDFHGEYVYAFGDQPSMAGFRFQSDESTYPIIDGSSVDRHFRLEVDGGGTWWLVPSTLAVVDPNAYETTALKCGVGADAGCTDVSVAAASGYVPGPVELVAQSSYVLRVVGDDGETHYGVIRVDLLGYDGSANALMIFDWAYQLQPDNPELVAGG